MSHVLMELSLNKMKEMFSLKSRDHISINIYAIVGGHLVSSNSCVDAELAMNNISSDI